MSWLAWFFGLASYIGQWARWALTAFMSWFQVVRLWRASLPHTSSPA